MVYVFPVSLVISGVAWVVSCFQYKEPLRWVATITLATATFPVVVVISVPLAMISAQGDIVTAKQYCEDLVPALEDYKNTHGWYPKSVEGLLPKWRWRPRLLRKEQIKFYESDGNHYVFKFLDDGFIPNVYYMKSHKVREWHQGDFPGSEFDRFP